MIPFFLDNWTEFPHTSHSEDGTLSIKKLAHTIMEGKEDVWENLLRQTALHLNQQYPRYWEYTRSSQFTPYVQTLIAMAILEKPVLRADKLGLSL